MRNLKRVLSLVLAAMMLIGMMVVGASASSTYDNFTDKDEIVNQEAVNTMVSLGVLAGKEDGSYFAPQDIVTRGEMAKIIAVSLNGGKEPVLGNSANLPKFSDVSTDHWAYKYIAYCVQLNIIAGRGDGTFDPDAPVTGSEAAKMYLCALGYRADLEGLVGNEWELNTNILANQDVGLYEGLEDLNPSEGLTRDDTAQMCYNAIQADEVIYDNLQGSYEDVLQTVPNDTMLFNRFDVVKVTGILEANDKLSVNDADTVALEGKSLLFVNDVTGAPANANIVNLQGEQSFTVETSDDMVGQEIVLYVRFQNDLAPNAAASTVVGEPILTDNNTVVETNGRLKDADAVRTALRAGGLTGIGNTAVAYCFDHTGRHAGTATGITDTVYGTRSAGVLQRFIDNNGNGTPDYIIQIVPSLAVVTAVNTTTEKYTLSAPISVQPMADVKSESELAKGDVVLVTLYSDGNYYAELADTVEGTVTAYNNANNTITIDGTSYANGAGAQLPISGVNKTLDNQLIGGEYRLYLDNFGNVLGYEEISAPIGNYAIVRGYTVSGNPTMGYSARIKLLMQDGSTATYDVDAASSAVELGLIEDSAITSDKEDIIFVRDWLDPNETTDGSRLYNHMFAYELDGNTVTLGKASEMNDKYTEADFDVQALNKNTSTYKIDNNADSVVADNNTVFFFQNGDGSYSVVTGLNKLPSSNITADEDGEVVYYTTTNETKAAKAIFVKLTGDFTSTKDYAFITADPTETTDDGVTVYQYPVVLSDGTEDILTSKSNNATKNAVWEYEPDGSYVKFTTDVYMRTKARVTEVGNGSISLVNVESDANMGSIVVDSSTVIWDVRNDVESASGLSENDVIAYICDNVDNTVKAIYIYDTALGDLATAPAVLRLYGTAAHATAGNAVNNLLGTRTQIQAPAAGDTLGVTYRATAGQDVNITINGEEIEDVESVTARVRNSADTYAITDADIAKGYVTVTVSISEDDKDSWTATYDVPIAFQVDRSRYYNVGSTVTVQKAAGQFFRLSNETDVTVALEADARNRVTFTMPANDVTLTQVYQVALPEAIAGAQLATNAMYNVDFTIGGESYAGRTVYLPQNGTFNVTIEWAGLAIGTQDDVITVSTSAAGVTFKDNSGTKPTDGKAVFTDTAKDDVTVKVTVGNADITDLEVTGQHRP